MLILYGLNNNSANGACELLPNRLNGLIAQRKTKSRLFDLDGS
jgi:hypothetical protein